MVYRVRRIDADSERAGDAAMVEENPTSISRRGLRNVIVDTTASAPPPSPSVSSASQANPRLSKPPRTFYY